jgi:hypothetical protein
MKKLEVIVAVVSIAALIIAVFAWLFPFNPVGTSPLISTPTVQIVQQGNQSVETATPVLSPTQTSIPTIQLPVAITPCDGRINTGIGKDMVLNIQVPSGQVAYAAGWGWDGQYGGVIVTITGQYEGTHTLNNGLYCPPMPANSEVSRQTEVLLQRECKNGGGCPITVLLP